MTTDQTALEHIRDRSRSLYIKDRTAHLPNGGAYMTVLDFKNNTVRDVQEVPREEFDAVLRHYYVEGMRRVAREMKSSVRSGIVHLAPGWVDVLAEQIETGQEPWTP